MGEKAADIVRKFREEVGLTQTQFAGLLKSSQPVISDIESGGQISKKLAKKLSALTGEPIEKFI